MRASHLVLLVAVFALGCSQKSEDAKAPPVEETDSAVSETDDFDGLPEEPVDPMVTVIRTTDGESVTSEVLLSSLHLGEFPPPQFGSPHDIWDENVTLEIIVDGDQRTQVLSYNTLAMTAEYVDFYMAQLSGAKEGSGDSSYIVSGKNEFGNEVVMEYILPVDAAENPLVRITVVE